MPAPKADTAVTLGAVIARARRRLSSGGMDDPALEARMIVEHFTGTDRREAIVRPERPVPTDQLAAIDDALARRLAGEPVHRIFGWRDFYGLRLKLSPDTLEPRPDTETLVDAVVPLLKEVAKRAGPSTTNFDPLSVSGFALDTSPPIDGGEDAPAAKLGAHPLPSRSGGEVSRAKPETERGRGAGARPGGEIEPACYVRILDLGTGTGAIALAILSQVPEAVATAADISPGALATATQNAAATGLRDRFIPLISDWFSCVHEKFHAIVSNPPYITSSEIDRLQPEVRLHDPRRALDGGVDGLDAYRKIADGAAGFLEEGGLIAVEIGEGQGPEVERIFAEAGYGLHSSHRDLAGTERTLVFCR